MSNMSCLVMSCQIILCYCSYFLSYLCRLSFSVVNIFMKAVFRYLFSDAVQFYYCAHLRVITYFAVMEYNFLTNIIMLNQIMKTILHNVRKKVYLRFSDPCKVFATISFFEMIEYMVYSSKSYCNISKCVLSLIVNHVTILFGQNHFVRLQIIEDTILF